MVKSGSRKTITGRENQVDKELSQLGRTKSGGHRTITGRAKSCKRRTVTGRVNSDSCRTITGRA